ncbi:hypothetical protein CF336_g9400 [Tilletia laevis]|uniref:Uncharacterized protein n=1 Tax=Tilletia caries TaxID=13290 RepID=A0A177SX80_9BASI|nr:hypothetical protein CF335_g9454 [Tilletia laevis]KAE8180125.1 hypothetical protein CF336_g9400 [Tilletia laevis]KAE8236165.1 hypothetical protein A4X03_0g9535 [Tilletia caries]
MATSATSLRPPLPIKQASSSASASASASASSSASTSSSGDSQSLFVVCCFLTDIFVSQRLGIDPSSSRLSGLVTSGVLSSLTGTCSSPASLALLFKKATHR